MTQRRVVVTGMGVVCCLGETLDSFWDALVSGRSGIVPITRFDVSTFPTRFGGECPGFQPEKWFTDKTEVKRVDRFAQFAVAAGSSAIEDSGIEFSKVDRDRVGCIIGSGIGGIYEIEEQHKILLERGVRRVSPYTVPKMMANAAAGQISIRHGLTGPSSAIATACASAANAIGDAFRSIRYGDTDIMVTGGAEAALTAMGTAAFCALRALSTRNEEPTRASRPFDKDRDGFVMSEGAGVVILEEYEHARKRGARIHAELLGYGTTGDGCHITQPEPEGRGAARAMRLALGDAKLNPDQIGYINAHGTSTQLGDKAETLAVKSVFGPAAKKVAVSSTKSAHGHLLGASGGVELVASILALTRNCLPPTINLENPDEGCDLDYVPNTAREARVDYALSNSFGFGGHNASLVVGRV